MSSGAKGYALQFAFDRLIAEGFEAFAVIDADTMVEAKSFDRDHRTAG